MRLKKTKIKENNIVLDIGSGIGGPARYLANKTNSIIYAVELQKSLNDIASELTNNYKLEKKQTLKLSQAKLDQVKALHLVKH